MKFSTVLCLAAFFGGVFLDGVVARDYSVEYLSGPSEAIACPNPETEVFCANAELDGDWEGTATVRFDHFQIDALTGLGTYSGEIDICVTAVKNPGGNVTPKRGCVTGTLSNGNLNVIGFTDTMPPEAIFGVYSEVSTTGGTGFFRKLTCLSVNTGSIDPSRTPFAEVLAFDISCSRC